MLRFLHFVVFVLLALHFALPEKFLLNGRWIPDPDSYQYFYRPQNKETVRREYVLLETHPRTALLCPKDYYIAKISQLLILGENETASSMNKQWAEHPQEITDNNEGYGTACPTLEKCLGYAACLFKFSNEFCRQDSAPGMRKLLNINITCEYGIVDFIVFLRHHPPKVPDSNPNDVKIHKEENLRNAIFEFSCPPLMKAIELHSYGGYCNNEPPPSSFIAEHLWKVLGRVESEICKEKIQQVYCAYQYNNKGTCIPPFYLKTSNFGKTSYNYLSLPNLGMRPDISKWKELLTYKQSSLIPARIGFLILVHKDIKAVMQLLHFIFKPHHFYVIHVDKASFMLRDVLNEEINKKFFDPLNLHILPEERSFRTSWASYEIVRAELECFEELLRMGIWDFAINLSGSDLPLRDVDDIAAALADYRGLSLFSHAHPRNLKSKAQYYNEALFACEGYVYSVTKTGGQPLFDELQIYSSSQWAVFHREFAEYVVAEQNRIMSFNKYQFFLQTTVVPDESYLVTALMNSPYSHTLRKSQVHYYKTFGKADKNNLCRHGNDDADFCGQGPLEFEMTDMEELAYSISHRAFFARKFHGFVHHPTRNAIMNLVQGGYYSLLSRFLPSSIIRKLASKAMEKLQSNDVLFRDYEMKDVVELRVFPSLYPKNPCCYIPFQQGMRSVVNYNYWIDFEMQSTRGQFRKARALVKPKFGGAECYGEGHLRMAFATSWTRTLPDGSNVGLQYSLPLPYHPVRNTKIWLMLVFHGNIPNSQCKAKQHVHPILFDDLDIKMVRASRLELVIQFVDAETTVHCKQFHTVEWNNDTVLAANEEDLSPRDLLPHLLTVECDSLKPGKWNIEIFKENFLKPYIYRVPLYLVDLQELVETGCTPSCPWIDEEELWSIEVVTTLPVPDFYQERKWENMLPIKVHKYSCQNSVSDRRGPCFKEWFYCGGGALVVTMGILFFYHWIVKPIINRTVLRPLRYIMYNVLFIVCSLLAQELLYLHYCH